MKKKILILLLISCSFYKAYPQSEQVKLYLKQIGFNEVMIGYIKKAIQIAKIGLTTIGDFKNGEFSLHRIFFDKLKIANPKIKNIARVGDIILLQVQMLKQYRTGYRQIRESRQFSEKEINYIASVFAKVLDDAASSLEELYTILSDGRYTMQDDERIKRIDKEYENIQAAYTFTQHFSKETLVMAMQRVKEKNDVDRSRDWYGIK